MAPDGVTTLGTPICVLVRNKDQKSQDYTEMEKAYRPSHADATYDFKYGIRAVAGGGRSSARETIGRVAAGAIAKKLLKTVAGCEVFAYVNRVRDVESNVDHSALTMEAIESNPVRCPDQEAADLMYKAIDEVRTRGESCGGEVTIVVKNCPKGLVCIDVCVSRLMNERGAQRRGAQRPVHSFYSFTFRRSLALRARSSFVRSFVRQGAPVFDKLEAEMAKALMSLPATKGFEIGSGFGGSRMLGSEHNDEFYIEDGKVRTRTNRSGGVQGGISNGEDIVMKIAFKPTATIARKQKTVNRENEEIDLLARGRHDPCVVPRAVPMAEAMIALVLADHMMMHFAQCELLGRGDAAGQDAQVRSQFAVGAHGGA